MFDLETLSRWSPDEVLAHHLGAPLPDFGVIHVAAVGQDRDSRAGRVVLKINEATPKSSFDCYLLNVVRAWADIVLTSGAIVRAEPQLSFEIDGPNAASREVLRRWRGNRLPLRVAVLSSGRSVAPGLGRLLKERPVTLFTAKSDARRVAPVGVEVVDSHGATPRSMVRWARSLTSVGDSGARARRVSVELGPSTTGALYREPAQIDRLLLSEYVGEVPPSVVGGAFLPGVDLAAEFEQLGETLRIGSWRFRQLGRR